MAPEDWGEAEANLWEQISGDYGDMQDDSHAMALFDAGWIDGEISKEDRDAVREEFFEYAIDSDYFDNEGDFDWAAWREANDY